MILRSLRARVAAAAAAAIVLAVALLSLTLGVLYERDLRRGLDDTLRERAGQVARLSATAPGVLVRPGALDASLGGRLLAVQVVDRDGGIVARSSALGGRVLPLASQLLAARRDGRSGFADARFGGEPLRAFVAPLTALGGGAGAGGAVAVASSTSEVDATSRRLRVLALLAGSIAAVVAALAATVLARRALRPLDRLAGAAREIEASGDAARRLPAPERPEEVGSLARTLNAMLAGLERARERERRFVADASHELRTPLTALRGNAAYVARHGADADALADLEADADRLARLLDDLLALAREDAGARPEEPVRLDELASEAAAVDGRVDVVAPEPVWVAGDRDALRRALANLVENALRHGPPAGRVTITAERRGGRAILAVQDEGPGLTPEDAAHAFARFWRGAEASSRPGSGLGLAIVRATAERHGGTAHAEGARVVLDLPTSHDPLRPGP